MTTSKKLPSPFSNGQFYLCSLDNQHYRILDLTAGQHKILAIILGNLNDGNRCSLSVGDISDIYGIGRPYASKCIKALVDHRLIYKIKRTIVVDPHYCWRGDVRSHYQAIAEHKKLVPDYSSVIDILHQRSPF